MRTEAEIKDNNNTELTGSEDNLWIYYQFNEGTAGGNNAGVTTVPDKAPLGGNNDGTLIDFTLSGTSSNWVADTPSLTPVIPSSCTAVIGCTDDLISDVQALNLSASAEDVLVRILQTGKDRFSKSYNTGATNVYTRFKLLVDRDVSNTTDAAALKTSADAIIDYCIDSVIFILLLIKKST